MLFRLLYLTHGMSSIVGIAEKSGLDGAAPSRTSRSPIAAIIAPLSVHSRSGGTRSSIPAASQRSCASDRTRLFAATPPTITNVSTSLRLHANSALRVTVSATAS